MDGTTFIRTLAAIALVSASAGCSGGDDDAASTSRISEPSAVAETTDADSPETTASSAPPTEAPDSTVAGNPDEPQPADNTVADSTDPPPATEPTETTSAPSDDADDSGGASCPRLADDDRQTLDAAVPESPAPGRLADAILPTDEDGVAAVFDALPTELIGGTKEIVPRATGHLNAAYQPPGFASQYGFQAVDLRVSFVGSMLPEPRADVFVAFWVLSDDDDYVVEASGRDGDLYWVTFINTASGYGIEGVEELYTIAWGDSCQPWGFTAAAPTPEGRDELIAAFVAATEAVAT